MLVDFQKKYGLVADGIIGKKTATKIKEVFGLTDIQTAYFLGQGSVETSDFKLKRENGRYSESQLKKYFSYYKNRPEEAQQDAYNEVVIFNKVYADKNRSKNLALGNTQIGDGYKFRGNSAGQTTGRYNHQVVANKVKDQSIMDNPDNLWKNYYLESFDIYLKDKKVYPLMTDISRKTSDLITSKVNGPAKVHAEKRYERTQHYYKLLTK
ncbi:hypothetical protein [Empedobacter falsenii]|uniref:hypothetical protein n=1 Tax=Empedobacter falsenii TaxID=343874 RepID=UPI001C8DF8B3|nr:hypothetical protein [Empedobacter falsenii]MBY0066804.1 hypothetical protein [Empedobacter falsenii]